MGSGYEGWETGNLFKTIVRYITFSSKRTRTRLAARLRLDPMGDGRRISTDLGAVGGAASRPELGLLPPLVLTTTCT